MKKIISMILVLGIMLTLSATAISVSADTNVNIPDTGLKMALTDNDVDLDGDYNTFTVAEMEKVKELYISAYAIHSLEGLQYCKNLEILLVDNNPIESLEPLKNLTRLVEINIDNYHTVIVDKDDSNYAYRDYAYDVVGDFDGIKDLSPLKNIKTLKRLNINGNNISDISPLAGLTSLVYIEANDNKISDISALSNLKNLSTLWMSDNQVVDITPLAGLTKIDDLDLWANKVHDITPIGNLVNLEMLDLDENYIGDISPLANLTKLEDIYFDANYIDLSEKKNTDLIKQIGDTLYKNTGFGLTSDYDNQNEPVKAAKNLAGTSESDGIKLTWTNSAQAAGRTIDITQIFRYDSAGKPALIGTVEGDAATYTDTTAVEGVSYKYAVRTGIEYDGGYVTSCLSDSATATKEAAAAIMYGDLDGNKNITSGDALTALKASVGLITLTEEQTKAANVDGKGGVTSSDALLILKYSVGLISSFPVEQ